MPYSTPWITNRCRCSPSQPKTVCTTACTSATLASPVRSSRSERAVHRDLGYPRRTGHAASRPGRRTRLPGIYRDLEGDVMTHRPVATAGGPTAGGEPLGPAVASFLAERDLAPSSHRVYVLALHRLLDRVGTDTPLAQVSPRMLAEFMTATYPHLAPASYNRVVATLSSLFAYTPARAGPRPRRPPAWNAAAPGRTGPRTPAPAPSGRPSCSPSSTPTTRCGRRPCGGCWMRPPPAPARSSPSTSSIWTWLPGAPWPSARAAGPRSSAGRPRPPGCCPDSCTAGGPARCSSPTSPPHPVSYTHLTLPTK